MLTRAASADDTGDKNRAPTSEADAPTPPVAPAPVKDPAEAEHPTGAEHPAAADQAAPAAVDNATIVEPSAGRRRPKRDYNYFVDMRKALAEREAAKDPGPPEPPTATQ
jgi:hypothetical protein